MSDPKISQMDKALNRYYLLNNQNDYLNEENRGKFQVFCEDHQFYDDDVIEELKQDPDDSQLLLFDEDGDFPFCEPNENKEIKAHKILKQCYNDPNAYMDDVLLPPPLKVTCKDWKDAEKKTNDVIKICKSQLNTIFTSHLEQDTTLLMALAIGYKLHEPYLQLLSDTFLRDSVKDDNLANVEQWAKKNKHIQSLDIKQGDAKHAIRSFFKRMCPKLVLPLQTKIQDSLLRVSQIIEALVKLVYNTASNQQQTTCPFAMDSCIIFDKVICAEKMENVNSKVRINIIPNKPLSTMIDWLKRHKKWNEYKQHFEIFEQIVLDIFVDDNEFEIEQVLEELLDEENSEIVQGIKDDNECEINYTIYIEELKKLITIYEHELEDFKQGKYIQMDYDIEDEKK
eukprot:396427_1